MLDYMKALYYRFNTPTDSIESLEQQTDKAHKQLAGQLGKQQRKLLLRLVDMEGTLRDQACINSFISGYRLAHGIHQELLTNHYPYNFEAEEEQQACERSRLEQT